MKGLVIVLVSVVCLTNLLTIVQSSIDVSSRKFVDLSAVQEYSYGIYRPPGSRFVVIPGSDNIVSVDFESMEIVGKALITCVTGGPYYHHLLERINSTNLIHLLCGPTGEHSLYLISLDSKGQLSVLSNPNITLAPLYSLGVDQSDYQGLSVNYIGMTDYGYSYQYVTSTIINPQTNPQIKITYGAKFNRTALSPQSNQIQNGISFLSKLDFGRICTSQSLTETTAQMRIDSNGNVEQFQNVSGHVQWYPLSGNNPDRGAVSLYFAVSFSSTSYHINWTLSAIDVANESLAGDSITWNADHWFDGETGEYIADAEVTQGIHTVFVGGSGGMAQFLVKNNGQAIKLLEINETVTQYPVAATEKYVMGLGCAGCRGSKPNGVYRYNYDLN